MRSGLLIALIGISLLFFDGSETFASSCQTVKKQSINFKKGALCWHYEGDATHFSGRFLNNQSVYVRMPGRVPSVWGPNGFFVSSQSDDSILKLRIPVTGDFTFEFSPCAERNKVGTVDICTQGAESSLLSFDGDKNKLPECQGNYLHNCQGTFTWPTGDNYVGEWRDGLINGQGTFTWPDGTKYVGEWKDGKKTGQGTLTYGDGQWKGDKYVGEFKDDKIDGQGTYTYANGGKYVGEFKDNIRHGEGVEYAANGSITLSGIWSNDKLIREANVEPIFPVVPDKKRKEPPETAEGSSGTAFRIAPGQFVTNHHVVENCKTMVVGGKQGGSVLEIDPKNDLALISVPNDSGETASIRTTRTVLNEAVTAAGFPLQGAFSGIAITNGTVSRLSGLQGDTGQIQISAPVQPGNSGGPLVDSAGNVIGVVSGKLNALKVADAIGDIPQNINFAIGGNILRAFLDAKGISYKEAGREEDLRGEQIAALASSFTVLVECK